MYWHYFNGWVGIVIFLVGIIGIYYQDYNDYLRKEKTAKKTSPLQVEKKPTEQEAPRGDLFSCLGCKQAFERKFETDKNTCQACFINKKEK